MNRNPPSLRGALCSLALILTSCIDSDSPPELTLETPDQITAFCKYQAVRKLATSLDPGVELKGISSDNMHWNGTASSWVYRFATRVPPQTYYYFSACFDTVFLDSVSSRGTVGDAFITHEWGNSDVAARIAEEHGGREFRSATAVCVIYAGLGEPVVPNPKTYWYIVYRAAEDRGRYLAVTIDAETGEIRPASSPDSIL